MSDQEPIDPQGDGPKRMSPTVKLALMGVGAAALLYSCTPAGMGFRGMPYLFGFGNPFYRAPMATTCPPGLPADCNQQANRSGGSGFTSGGGGGTGAGSSSTSGTAGESSSARGGFGSTATAHGTAGS